MTSKIEFGMGFIKSSRSLLVGCQNVLPIVVVTSGLLFGPSAVAAVVVLPNALTSVNGGTQLSTGTGAPLNHNAAGTYQMIIDASHLTSLGEGTQITGLSFRLRGAESTDAPSTGIFFTDYEIRLGKGALNHGSLSTTFANNIQDATLVRDNSLTIGAGSFESDGSPSPFGTDIGFTTPSNYVGGNDLVIEIRHTTGTGPVAALAIDANVSLPAYGNSIGDTFVAFGGNSFSSTSGAQQGFATVRISYAPVPEPTESMAAAGLSLLAIAAWRRWLGHHPAPAGRVCSGLTA